MSIDPNAEGTPIGGQWLILGGAILWGTTGTAQAYAPAGSDPLVIGTLRLVVSGIALLLLALHQGEMGRLKFQHALPLLAAALFIAGYQLCFFTAVATTGVAVGTVVGIGSAPIAGGILGFLFRGEQLGRAWLAATMLTIIGCTLLSLTSGIVTVDSAGILLAVGAGACYAAFTLVLKRLLQQSASLPVIAVVFCLGAVILSPLLLIGSTDWLMQPRAIGVILHLGVMATAVPYLLFAWGLKTTQVSTATTLSLAEPMTAAILGTLLLGEQLNLQAGSGVLLIFTGLALLIQRNRNIVRDAVQ